MALYPDNSMHESSIQSNSLTHSHTHTNTHSPSHTHTHTRSHLSLCIADGGGPMEHDGPLVLPYSQPPPSSFPSPFVPIAAQIYSMDPQQQFCKHLIPV